MSKLIVYYRDELGVVGIEVHKELGMFDALDFVNGLLYFMGADRKNYAIPMDSVVSIMHTL